MYFVHNDYPDLRDLERLYLALRRQVVPAMDALDCLTRQQAAISFPTAQLREQAALAIEVQQLRVFTASRTLHAAHLPLLQEVRALRYTPPRWDTSKDQLAIRQLNVMAAEGLCSKASNLLARCRAVQEDSSYRHVHACSEPTKEAPVMYFISDHGNPSLDRLSASFEALFDLYRLGSSLASGIKQSKANRVQQATADEQVYIAREQEYEVDVLLYRECLRRIQPLLCHFLAEITATQPLTIEPLEFLPQDIAIREICISAARGLYSAVQKLVANLDRDEAYPATTSLYGQNQT